MEKCPKHPNTFEAACADCKAIYNNKAFDKMLIERKEKKNDPALFCKFHGHKGRMVGNGNEFSFTLQCPECLSTWMVNTSLVTKDKIQEPYFTPEMVFANMLRLWKVEDIREFYDMLGRRPECAEPIEKFPLGTEKLLGSILGPLEDYMNDLEQPERPDCVINAEVVIGQILADKACMKSNPLHPSASKVNQQ